MREFKIQKTTGGVVHAGSWHGNESDPRTSKYGYFNPFCGSGVVYAPATLRQIAGFRELKSEVEITCKKCIKLLAKLEEETTPESQPEPETVEETPAPESPELDELEEMEAEYEDLILIGRGLKLLEDSLTQKMVDMMYVDKLEAEHPRRVKVRNRLMRTMDLEDANLKARKALAEKIREARKTAERINCPGCGEETQVRKDAMFRSHSKPDTTECEFSGRRARGDNPFHRQVKDAINLKW